MGIGVSVAGEQARLLGLIGRELDFTRRSLASWARLECTAEAGEDGRVHDRNRAARFAVLWASQYDRHPDDLELARFLLREETRFYRQVVPAGMGPDLELAGFLVAARRRPEDLWLHWDAKSISFDTALGYSLFYLLAGGVEVSAELVRASTHPDRDWILRDITGVSPADSKVSEWLEQRGSRFPSDPGRESLDTWASHASCLGEREAARLFITEWASRQPRTGQVLNKLQFDLAGLGYLSEAIDVQEQAVALGGSSVPFSNCSRLLTLARLQRRAADHAGVLRTLSTCAEAMPPEKTGQYQGLWRHFAKEYFLLAAAGPEPGVACGLLAAADRYLSGIPRLWMDGILDAAITAAEHAHDTTRIRRYQELRRTADRECEQERQRYRRPGRPE
jgi:hypothetical protein